MDNNMTLHINNAVLHQAFQYADAKGVDLSQVVESFLLNLIHGNRVESVKKISISDKVKALAGRIPLEAQNLDWKKEKEEYLMKKYGL